MLTFHQIAQILGHPIAGSDQVISHFAFDSRMHLSDAAQTVFVAIDAGHQYLAEMEKKGVSHFIIEKEHTFEDKNSHYVLVDNAVKALQQLATAVRNRSKAAVVGITGSNGKTLVKDALSAILGQSVFTFVSSPRSYNSQLGVAVSVLQLQENTEIGVFEAGISKPNEMEHLAAMIAPQVGVLTHIGDAHQEGFKSIEAKIEAKLKLFLGAKKLILNRDGLYFETIKKMLSEQGNDAQIISFSKHLPAKYTWALDGHTLTINRLAFKVKNSDNVSVESMIYAIVCALELGIEFTAIERGIAHWHISNNRLSLLPGKLQSVIINDSYTNDLAAMQAAISFTQRHSGEKELCAIISTIANAEEKESSQIINALNAAGFKQIYTIGGGFEHLPSINNYGSVNDFFTRNSLAKFANKAVLIKGQRKFELEKISHWLEDKKNITQLEIRLDLMLQNYQYFKSLLDVKTKIMLMVKAHAYGSGAAEVAKYLQTIKPDYLGVAHVDEAIALRDAGIKTPILVLYSDLDDLSTMFEYQLEPIIYSMHQLDALNAFAGDLPAAHIEIDTGMHRLGFIKAELPVLVQRLKDNSKIKVSGIMSHLSSADMETKDEFTHQQISEFDSIAVQIEKALGYKTLKHIANSAGVHRFKTAHFDMVRVGIGIYGHIATEQKLNAVSVLKTKIAQVKTIPVGEGVGYGNSEATDKERTIAILPIGYADGFDRGLGNGKWKVIVHHTKCPTVGNICMDMCMIDVSGLNCQEGDDAILFGDKNTVEQMAESIGTIPYEIIARISERVKRIYISEQ